MMNLDDTEQMTEESLAENDTMLDSLGKRAVKPVKVKKEKKKKNGTSFFNIALSIITILALSCLLSLLIKDCQSTNDVKAVSGTSVASSSYSQEQLNTLEQAKITASEEAKAELKAELLTAFQSGESVMSTLRAMYPEYLIFYDGDHYSFSPIDSSLPKNPFNPANFTVHENGEITYHSNGIQTSVKGIDISKYQGEIDWPAVAQSGIHYAIIRGGIRGYGSGALVADENFEANITGALSAGVEVGTYFFTQAINEQEAIEEADFLISLIAPYSITYPVVLDVEIINERGARTASLTCDQRTKNAIAFLERIKEKGYTPMLYGNLKTYTQLLDMKQLTGYEKWFAFYDSYLYFPYECNMWQYSDTATIDGIEGPVDLNIYLPKE